MPKIDDNLQKLLAPTEATPNEVNSSIDPALVQKALKTLEQDDSQDSETQMAAKSAIDNLFGKESVLETGVPTPADQAVIDAQTDLAEKDEISSNIKDAQNKLSGAKFNNMSNPDAPAIAEAEEVLEGAKGAKFNQMSPNLVGDAIYKAPVSIFNPDEDPTNYDLGQDTTQPPEATDFSPAKMNLGFEEKRGERIAQKEVELMDAAAADEAKQYNDDLSKEYFLKERMYNYQKARRDEAMAAEKANSPLQRGSILGNTTEQRLGRSMAIALSGLGQAFLLAGGHGATENGALNIITKLVDDEMADRQKDRAYWNEQLKMYKSQAEAELKNALDITNLMYQKTQDVIKNNQQNRSLDIQAATLDNARKALEIKQQQEWAKQAKQQNEVDVESRVPVFGDNARILNPKLNRQLTKELSDLAPGVLTAESINDQYNSYVKKYGNDFFSRTRVPWSDASADAKKLELDIGSAVAALQRIQLTGGGAMTNFEQGILQEYKANPVSFMASLNPQKAKQIFDSTREAARRTVDGKVATYGVTIGNRPATYDDMVKTLKGSTQQNNGATQRTVPLKRK